ncbi:MAG: glycosyltransferase family 2 protein [Flavobacterium sp.]|uniref:glycosyltransferase family 2 protein n=1 Tax=Flavobacterium sp. TaxID=239 RepID=UPI0022BADF35|nr:glycosyltransferase family 2 protein [Flavobacterium sp.]MCZ8196454.1 glycosyltransferase family 2 protein [Flavobacterium sp.]
MIGQKKYDIAAILINYNSNSYTKNCIESIIAKTASSLNYQIVIIDNASEKEDFSSLESYIENKKYYNVQLVRSAINLGFGAGNMLGVHYSNANYLAFINNDSLLSNDCLSIIYSKITNNPDFGICGPLAYKEDGSLLPTLDHFASPAKEILGRKLLEKLNPEKYPNRKIIYSEPKRGQFISGSFMIVKSEDFNTVGGFDTNLFLYFEETDLCKRLSKIKKYAYLIPEAKYVHFHGVSTPSSITIKTEHKISYLYVIRKHYGYFWHQVILNKLRFHFFFKSLFKPSYWKIFRVLLVGAPLSESLKLKQKITS